MTIPPPHPGPQQPDERPAPVMFRGIRYGRPGEKKFSLRLLLVMLLLGVSLTFLIDWLMPDPPPAPPPAPAEGFDVQIGVGGGGGRSADTGDEGP